MARLFVAVWPPAELIEQLRALARPERTGLRWTTEDQWHVTLRFFGSVEDEVLPSIREALGQVAASLASASAVAGPGPRPLGDRVWILPVAGLEVMGDAVAQATASLGQPPPHRAFRGHLTLARGRVRGAFRDLPRPEVDFAWVASEVTLVSSTLHPRGARYEVVDRWVLPGG